MFWATGNQFSDEIVSRYVYGNSGKPADLRSESILTRAPLAQASLTASQYMEGPGRFASPVFFELVQKFFTLSNSEILDLVEQFEPDPNFLGDDGLPIQNQVVTYDLEAGTISISKNALAQMLDITKFGLSFHQMIFDDGKDDYFQRLFVWGTSAFKIDDDATFVIDLTGGNRKIAEFAVLPREASETFDFEGGQASEYFEYVSRPLLDPFEIGSSVEIALTGAEQVERRTYTQADYLADKASRPLSVAGVDHSQATTGGWLSQGVGNVDVAAATVKMAATFAPYYQRIHSSGVVQYYEEGYDLYYGSSGPDVLSTGVYTGIVYSFATGWPHQAFYPSQPKGAAIVGGAGSDDLTGDLLSSNLILSGSGQDKLSGGLSEDVFELGQGAKTVDGSFGFDTVRYVGGSNEQVQFYARSGGGLLGKTTRIDVSHGGVWDTLDSVEKIVGSDYADLLIIQNLDFFTADVEIDLGSTSKSSGAADTLNLQQYAGVGLLTVDLRGTIQEVRNSAGEALSFRGVEAVVGSDGGDTIYGGNAGDDLRGGGGYDTIRGGSAADRIVGSLTEDDDDNAPDTLTGGGGGDLFYAGNGDTITDPTRGDAIYLRGKRLTGGEESESDSGIYRSPDGGTYVLAEDGTLTFSINPQISIQNFSNGAAGIRLIDKEPDNDEAEERRDPLIIDLDGDRNVVRSLGSSTAYFDLDNDGFVERVAWARAGDGFLARDLDGNGRIDSGSEMFGTGRVDLDGGTPQEFGEEGFAELALHDANLDGAITAADTVYETLRVWIDANGDAVTDAGELRTLAELGIVSISLVTSNADHVAIIGDSSLVTRASTVLFADGGSRAVYDAYLAISQYDAYEILDPDLDLSGVADLPTVLGTGAVSDLHVAMARDPGLEEMVRELASLPATEAHQILGRVERIVLRWTGADEVAADTRGANINAQWLVAIEKITGKGFNQALIGPNPRGDAAAILIAEWRTLVANTAAKLVGQSALGAALTPGLEFAAGAFYNVADGTDLETLLGNIAAATPANGRDAVLYWGAMVAIVDRYRSGFGLDQFVFDTRLSAAITSTGLAIGLNQLRRMSTGGGSDGVVFGVQSNLLGVGRLVSSDDVLVAGSDTRLLDGGGGDDIYIVGAGNAAVTVADVDGRDTLYLTDLQESELVIGLATAGDRQLLTLGNSAGAISAQFEFAISTTGLRTGVDTVIFKDGTSRQVSDLVSQVLVDGRIRIGSTSPNFSLEGDEGDNVLLGFGPSDIYRFGPGGGNDVVSDASGGDDSLLINAALADVTLSRGEDDAAGDVIVTLNASGDTIRLAGQRSAAAKAIENFVFTDTTLSLGDIDRMFTIGTPDTDVIVGSVRDDRVEGRAGNDQLRGGEGRDTYHFDAGWGDDVIVDPTRNNFMEFGAGIAAEDIQVSRGGAGNADLILAHADGDRITVADGLRSPLVGELRFADGTVLTLTDLIARIEASGGNVIAGTAFDDTLTGTLESERFVGNGGNDIFEGNGGLDTYEIGPGRATIYASDVGIDTVIAPGEAVLSNFRFADEFGMQLRFGGGLQTSVAYGALDYVRFANGSVLDFTAGGVTAGGVGNDFLYHLGSATALFTPGAGNDVMIGSTSESGRDTYIFEAGFGHDIIYDMGGRQDLVEFQGADLDLVNAAFERNGQDLVISFANTGDRLTIEGHFWNYPFYPDTAHWGEPGGAIEGFYFNNQWLDAGSVIAEISRSTAGDDIVMTGTGTSNQSQLTRRNGGAGNDILIGGSRQNGYDFDVGFGHDIIKDGATDARFNSSDDFVYFGSLASTDVSITRSADDPLSIVFTILATGETLTIDGTPDDGFNSDWSVYSNPNRGTLNIERFIFSDVTLERDDVIDIVLAGEGTAGADEIYGLNSSGRIDAGAGDDRIHLLNGNETIVLRANGGHDILDFAQYESSSGGFTIEFDGIDLSKVYVAAVSEVDGIKGKHARIHTGDGTTLTILNGRDTTLYPPSEVGSGILFNARDADGEFFGIDYVGQTGPLFGSGPQGGPGDDVLQADRFGEPGPFDPGAGNDLIFGSGGEDTLIFDIGYGTDRYISDPILEGFFGDGDLVPNEGTLTVVVGSQLTSSEISLNWLLDEPGLMELVIDATGDRLIFDPDRLGAIRLADTVLTTVPIEFVARDAQPGSTVDGDPANELITALDGDVRVRFGASSGSDSLNDARFDAALAGTGDLQGWTGNIVELGESNAGGQLYLDDFEFIRDIDNPADLVVIERQSGAQLVIKNQFAFGVSQLAGGWSPVDVDGDGISDWSLLDANGDGVPDFASLDSDSDGTPNWIEPDFDGDGVSDWVTERYADFEGDGDYSIGAADYDLDGNADEYWLYGAEDVSLYDNDGDGVPDEYEIDSVGTIMSAPTDANGNVDWLLLDADGDGEADLASLDPDGDGQLNWFRGYSALSPISDWDVYEYTDLYNSSGDYLGSREQNDDGSTSYYISLGFEAFIVARDINGDLIPDEYGFDNNFDGEPDPIWLPGTPAVVEYFAIPDFFGDELYGMSEIVWRMETRSVPSGGTNATVIDLAALRPVATSGADILLMGEGETLDSLAGEDLVWSTGAGGVFHFGAGDGNDRLAAADPISRAAGAGDILHFDGILDPAQVRFLRGGDDGADLIVEILATGERLTVSGQLGSQDARGIAGQPVVRAFRFEGGLTLDAGQVVRRLGNDTGGNPDGGGATGPIASGDDGGVLGGEDTNDDLRGGSGDDVYLFERGGAEDNILDAGGFDMVRFGQDIGLVDLYFSRAGTNGEDLLVEVLGLERLTLTIAGQFGDAAQRIERFTFADGSMLEWNDIQRTILDLARTSGDDTIAGFAGDDIIRGGKGNDVLSGTGGNDLIFGDDGRDRAVFVGRSDEYIVTVDGDITTVTDTIADRDGSDTLHSIEDIVFLGDDTTTLLKPANSAPQAGDLQFDMEEDGTIVIARAALLAAGSDADGDSLQLGGVSQSAHGQAWIGTDGNIRFRATRDYAGEAGFSFTLLDGNGGSATARVTIAVLAQNDSPRIAIEPHEFTVFEDSPIVWLLPAGSITDPDGDALTVSARLTSGEPLPQWLSFDGQRFAGTPPENYNGSLEIELVADDGQATASSILKLNILPVNDAPTVANEPQDQSIRPGQAFAFTVSSEIFVDAEGDPLTLQIVAADGSALPTWLTVEGLDVSGTAPVDFAGPLDLAVVASDGRAASAATFALLAHSNTAPEIGVAIAPVSIDEDTPLDFAVPADAFADPDGDPLLLSAIQADGSPLPAWLRFDGSRFTGTPPQDFNGVLNLRVIASDGEAEVDSVFELRILPVNDAPVLATPIEDRAFAGASQFAFTIPAGSFADVDGDQLSYSVALADGSALPAWLAFDPATRTFSGLAPNADAALDIRIVASDGTLTASDRFALTIDAQETGGGSTAGFSFANLNSWYNPSWGGGYNVTFTYQVQPEAMAEGELKAWDIVASYAGAGTIVGGWVDGFPGPASFAVTPDGAIFSTDGQNYQPELAEGQTFQITLQVNGAPYAAGDFGFTIFDRDPAFNLADAQDTSLMVSPTNDWGGGLGQNVSLTNTSQLATDDWQVVLDIPQGVSFAVTSVWGATATKLSTGDILFKAVDSNKRLAPGAQANFGFNASYAGVANLSFNGAHFGFTDSDARQFATVTASLPEAGAASAWTYGTSNSDTLAGSANAANRLFGAVGDDQLTGGALGDWLAGGSGDDTLNGMDGDDTFLGGHGNDQLFGGTGFDTARLLGYSGSYSLVTQGGNLGVRITDLSAIAHGDDGVDQLSSIERLVFKSGESFNIASPIILDLDGDGVETVSASNSAAMFDLNGDGLRDDTSWISAGDGFLFLDRNGDGTMSGAAEISFIDDAPNAASDLAGLRSFDSNADGVLDANDDRFADFGVWRDANGNGAVDAGETTGLTAAGIRSIGLAGTAVNGATAFGQVAIVNTGNFTLTDGSVRSFADAALTYFAFQPAAASSLADEDVGASQDWVHWRERRRPTVSQRNHMHRMLEPVDGWVSADVDRRFGLERQRSTSQPLVFDAPMAVGRVGALTDTPAIGIDWSYATMDMPLSRQAAESADGASPSYFDAAYAPTAHSIADEGDVARKLMLMRQEIASFGVRGLGEMVSVRPMPW